MSTATLSRGILGRTSIVPGDPEPEVGVSIRKGAVPGFGDHIRFDHVHDEPDGWMEYVNGSTHGRWVAWPVVAFWLPMERTL